MPSTRLRTTSRARSTRPRPPPKPTRMTNRRNGPFSRPSRPPTSTGKTSFEPLVGRRDLGDEVLDQLLVRQRLERHLALGQARGAGIDGFSVHADHALLAGVGVDAGEADREAWVAMDADPAQAVEHGLARLERHFVMREAAGFAGRTAPDLKLGLQSAPAPRQGESSGASATLRSSARNRRADARRGSPRA